MSDFFVLLGWTAASVFGIILGIGIVTAAVVQIVEMVENSKRKKK